MRLHDLKSPEGAKRKRKRVGRGPGSGWGQTAGRGQKGQKSRSGGKVPRGFEGGQTPLHRRLPKFGFTNPNTKEFSLINLSSLEKSDRFDASQTLTKALLQEKGFVKNLKNPIKLLGKGEMTKAIRIEVDKASVSAIEKVSQAGGEVILVQK